MHQRRIVREVRSPKRSARAARGGWIGMGEEEARAKVRRRGPSAKPTAAQVAELANVSRATVSRTLRGGGNVHAATRTRILEAAQGLGYPLEDPNATPSAAGAAAEGTVGLVMGELDNPFYNTVLAQFLDALYERRLQALCRTAVTLESSEREVRNMLASGVDALIIASSGLHSTAIAACRAAGVPIVLFNRDVPGANVASVQTDKYAGGRSVADLFALSGHARPAFVNGLEGASTNKDRRRGFLDRLSDLGFGSALEEYAEYTYVGGREAAKRLMLRPDRPDAIFCANDICAFGTMDGLRFDLGLHVPRDVSVVGFDDVPMAAWPSFDLTTVRQRRNLMVAETMTIIDELRKGLAPEPRAVTVEARLILRGSARLPQPEALRAEPKGRSM